MSWFRDLRPADNHRLATPPIADNGQPTTQVFQLTPFRDSSAVFAARPRIPRGIWRTSDGLKVDRTTDRFTHYLPRALAWRSDRCSASARPIDGRRLRADARRARATEGTSTIAASEPSGGSPARDSRLAGCAGEVRLQAPGSIVRPVLHSRLRDGRIDEEHALVPVP